MPEIFGKRLQQKNSDYSRIMFLLSNNEFPGLRRTLKAALKRGASAKIILHILQRALAGLYRPRGGFNKRELDISFLAKALGGPKLLYALQKSQGLASVSTVHRHQAIPQLVPSIGVPSKEEIDENISSFFNPEIKPPASYPGCSSLPGNILMFDGVALDTKCRYCPKRNAILGLCRELSHRVNTQVDSLDSVEAVRKALEDSKSETKVRFGSDANCFSPSDKTEKSEALAIWLKTVLDAWKVHPQGEAMHGPIWAIGSDGDAVFRLAKFMVCMVEEIDPNSAVGNFLKSLLGFNCFASCQGVIATGDTKHIIKFEHLSMLESMTVEKATQLLDPADKQNVPKAVTLVQELNTLQDLPMPLSPGDVKTRKAIIFFSEVLSYFVFPFIKVEMSLSEQKLGLGALINATFQRNPDLDRGHRRLKLSGALGIDHVNPKSWIGVKG
ncbi:hypothetical protein B0H14DRAFT_2606859 [Mycena olivaceomarginata]|nr:hypothetical protein B0H14DRAFT_2606859 [Mycena olivaceomarginata]